MRTMLVLILALVISMIGVYIYIQYRRASQPSLATIPEYTLSWAAYPLDKASPEACLQAEDRLSKFAAAAEAGYSIVDKRFLAAKVSLTGDALRHTVGDYLNRVSNYQLTKSGSSEPGVEYYEWRHSNRLQRLFDDRIIIAASLDDPIPSASGSDQIHVYGYFLLARTVDG